VDEEEKKVSEGEAVEDEAAEEEESNELQEIPTLRASLGEKALVSIT